MRLSLKITFSFCTACLLAICLIGSAHANAFQTQAKYAYLYDMKHDMVLLEKNAQETMGPSSMTKLMTLYLLFDTLKRGDIALDTKFRVSTKAWRKGGSKMYVKEGDYVTVKDLIYGIIVHSGNDACIVVAEGLSGTEDGFAVDMNYMAKRIGLKNSHFENSTGWPDPDHYMTSEDLGILTKRLIEDFPDYYKYFNEITFTYSGIKQSNRNRLLWKNIGVDGLKTGHTEAAGYGISVSGEQDGRRLVVIVNGLESEKARIGEAERLIRHGFRDYRELDLYQPGDVIENADVWMGQEANVPLVIDEPISYLVSRRISQKSDISLEVSYLGPIPAPIKQGDEIAELVIKRDGKIDRKVPLKAGQSVDKLSFFGRLRKLPSRMLLGQ